MTVSFLKKYNLCNKKSNTNIYKTKIFHDKLNIPQIYNIFIQIKNKKIIVLNI